MPETIHVGDIGTVFEARLVEWDDTLQADVSLDLSSATALQLIFESATGVVKPVEAVLTTDGLDGRIQYTTANATVLDSAGPWRWQCLLSLPGWTGHSEILNFPVESNLD
jgi:hypothetical protein